jgi:hypothetical protein
MQYEPAVQTVVMVRPSTIEDYKNDPDIRSTRRKLLIVLSIELV